MRTIVKGKNYEVPDRVRRYAERKLARLERLLDERSDAIVELSVEGHRSVADSHLVDVTLVVDGRTIRGRGAAATHEAGIDQVVDKVERRAVDSREKPRSRTKSGVGQAAAAIPEDLSAPASSEADDEDAAGVVKVKRFAIEPMFTEDAVARMEELGHAFFVFVDAETERIAILYRRRAGDYGVIEPMLGGGYTPRGGDSGLSGGAGSRRTRR